MRANTNDSSLFMIDTRDQVTLASSSNLFRIDTTAAPMVLDPQQILAGDVTGDKNLALDDLLLLSQVVGGQRALGDALIASAASADTDKNGTVNGADVRMVADWLLAAQGQRVPGASAAGFAIGILSPAAGAPGTLIEVTVTGEVAAKVTSVRFGTLTMPVFNVIDDHRLLTAVPSLPPGDVQISVQAAGWETPPATFHVLQAIAPATPPGAYSADVLAGIDAGFVEFSDALLPEFASLGIITSGQSGDMIKVIGQLRGLLQGGCTAVGSLTPEHRQILDTLFATQGMAGKVAELREQVAGGTKQLAELKAPRDSTMAPGDDSYAHFHAMMALDVLSELLTMAKVSVEVAAVAAAVPTGGASAVLFAVSMSIAALDKYIDGWIPTDLARLRAEFADGSPTMYTDTGKEVVFHGDFRTQSNSVDALLGFAMDGVFGLLDKIDLGGGLRTEMIKTLAFYLARAGYDNLYDSTLGQLTGQLFETWVHDVPVPSDCFSPSAIFVAKPPWVACTDAGTSPLATFELSSSRLLPMPARGTGELRFDASNIRPAGTWWGRIATLGLEQSRFISDEKYDPFTLNFNPGGDAVPLLTRKLPPLAFKLVSSTIQVRPNQAAAWSIIGPLSYSGTGSRDLTVRPGQYSISWGAVSGYNTPSSPSQTAADGDTMTFTGTYTQTIYNGVLQGVVKDGLSGYALAGVTLSFTDSGGKSAGSVVSNGSGIYSIPLPEGAVTASISKSGYVTTLLKATVTRNVTMEADVVLFAPNQPGNGTISGKVIHAINGAGVSGVSLTLRSGVNVTSGSSVATTTSDSSGNYAFLIGSGSYTVQASQSGYVSGFANVVAVGGQTISNQNVQVTQSLASGEWRIVLSWGASPADLDAHLSGPDGNAGTFHLYWEYSPGKALYPPPVWWNATLDVDDRDYWGPETMTVTGLRSGIYHYWVYNYSNYESTSSITELSNNSAAQVTVWKGTSSGTIKYATFNVPSGIAGNLWEVFTINGTTGTLTPVNAVSISTNEFPGGTPPTSAGIAPAQGEFVPLEPRQDSVVMTPAAGREPLEPVGDTEEPMDSAGGSPPDAELDNFKPEEPTKPPSVESPAPQRLTPRIARYPLPKVMAEDPDFSRLQALIDLPETVELSTSALPVPLPVGVDFPAVVSLEDVGGAIGGYAYELCYDPAKLVIAGLDAPTSGPYLGGVFPVIDAAAGRARVIGASSRVAIPTGMPVEAFVVRMRVLQSNPAPVLSFVPLDLLSPSAESRYGTQAMLSVAAGQSIIGSGSGQTFDELYAAWAAANLPPGERVVSDVSSVFGISNLLAFALGWEAGHPSTWSRVQVGGRDVTGIWLRIVRRRSVPGLRWDWLASVDLRSWMGSPVLEERRQNLDAVRELWEVRVPQNDTKRFYQLEISHETNP